MPPHNSPEHVRAKWWREHIARLSQRELAALTGFSVSRIVEKSCDELRKAARTPACSSASTWSCISAMSGETTTPTPGRSSAGIWKHSDLPPPVGISTSASPPFATCSTTSS